MSKEDILSEYKSSAVSVFEVFDIPLCINLPKYVCFVSLSCKASQKGLFNGNKMLFNSAIHHDLQAQAHSSRRIDIWYKVWE